jgi:hypothetical protein
MSDQLLEEVKEKEVKDRKKEAMEKVKKGAELGKLGLSKLNQVSSKTTEVSRSFAQKLIERNPEVAKYLDVVLVFALWVVGLSLVRWMTGMGSIMEVIIYCWPLLMFSLNAFFSKKKKLEDQTIEVKNEVKKEGE